MSFVVKNTGAAVVAWGGTADAVIFRDAAGRMLAVAQVGPGRQETRWVTGAASAEVVGKVCERAPTVASAEVTITSCRLTTTTARPGRETVSARVLGARAAAAVGAVVLWAAAGVPNAGAPFVGAVAVARAWGARGRGLVERTLKVTP